MVINIVITIFINYCYYNNYYYIITSIIISISEYYRCFE